MVHVSMGFDIEAAKPARGDFTLGVRCIVPMDSMGWGVRPRLDIFLWRCMWVWDLVSRKQNRPEVSSPLDSDTTVRDVGRYESLGLDIVWIFLQTSDERESPLENKLQARRKRMPSAFRTTHFTSWPHLRSVLVRPRGRNEGTCHSCLRAMWRQRFGTILYCFFRLFAGAYFVSYVKWNYQLDVLPSKRLIAGMKGTCVRGKQQGSA